MALFCLVKSDVAVTSSSHHSTADKTCRVDPGQKPQLEARRNSYLSWSLNIARMLELSEAIVGKTRSPRADRGGTTAQ